MISFVRDSIRFNFRTAGVAVAEGCVLLHRAEDEDFWTMPGGRVELGEAAVDALAREMLEEIGAAAEIGELLWTVENFFEYGGRRSHELGLYFRMTLPATHSPSATGPEFDGFEPGLRLIYRWHPLRALDEITIVPAFIGRALHALDAGHRHVVQRDDAAMITAP